MADLSNEDLTKLKDIINGIQGSHFPNQHADFIWNTFNQLNNSNERQPCTCGSAGSHWLRAVQFHREYIKNK